MVRIGLRGVSVPVSRHPLRVPWGGGRDTYLNRIAGLLFKICLTDTYPLHTLLWIARKQSFCQGGERWIFIKEYTRKIWKWYKQFLR